MIRVASRVVAAMLWALNPLRLEKRSAEGEFSCVCACVARILSYFSMWEPGRPGGVIEGEDGQYLKGLKVSAAHLRISIL